MKGLRELILLIRYLLTAIVDGELAAHTFSNRNFLMRMPPIPQFQKAQFDSGTPPRLQRLNSTNLNPEDPLATH